VRERYGSLEDLDTALAAVTDWGESLLAAHAA
jgi:hypothetical protein